VGSADYVFVSHSHFDHLYGADVLALGAGATVVASPESARCLREAGVPEQQLLVVTGGETVHCGPSTKVRVLPALHACLFAHSDSDTSVPCLGDLDVSAQDRAATIRRLFAGMDAAPAPAGPALVAMNDKCSRHDGGQLAYLLVTGGGSLLVSGSAGYWRGIFSGLRPDVALLSLGGRPNVDGEPFQGSTVDYMLEQVSLLRPGRVAFCHHDPLFPGLPGVDVGPAAAALRVPGAPAGYFEMEYATPIRLFG
jgi:L-ascorbate metabolism protein UlaG (beta-lactamase superfamily)